MTQAMSDGRQRQQHVRSTLVYLSRTGELPAMPQTATAALAIARDPGADADALGGVIRTDVALAARVIHVANSAAYARRAPAGRSPAPPPDSRRVPGRRGRAASIRRTRDRSVPCACRR